MDGFDKKTELIVQANVITESRQNFTAAQKNVVYMIQSKIRDNDPPGKVYTVSIIDLQKVLGIELNYVQFRKMTEELVKKVIHVDLGQLGYLALNLVSSGAYEKRKGCISFELSKEMRTFFFNLKKNFTQFQLMTALSLKSKFAKRIYEMLSQYKDTGMLYTSIEALKTRLGLFNEETGKEKYENFNMFRKKVLDVAKAELEEKGDIQFSYHAQKTKNKYTHLIFAISKKSTPGDTQKKENDQKTREKLVAQFHLSDWQATRILKKVPTQEIQKTLYSILLERSSGKIKNIGAYTAKVFDKKYNLCFFKKTAPQAKL